MIIKHPDYKNGYCLLKSATDDDLQKWLSAYDEIRVVFCNKETAKCFKVIGGYSMITINNKLNDGCFFINQMI